ncbi:DUF484 family protein [Abyssibacter sp.]|uniref:DUF484 family protein n=1 Tax=Abyssibacter sp. TaxID=2320200 RepID=UPI0025BF7F69|nr:DUF484 family protein [Abyssibacter sp.]MCK5859663.1 DUF484 family protein [Abyssibacter sp.]
MGSTDDKLGLAAVPPEEVAVQAATEEDVIAFIEQRPEFFAEHPQLLEEIELAHAAGSAASLIERQVAVLRQRNEQLRERMHQLAEVARQNERRMRKANELAVALLGAASAEDAIAIAQAQLTRAFAVDAVLVGLYDGNAVSNAMHIDHDHPVRGLYADLIRTGLIECGPLGDAARAQLFGEQAVASAAVVPMDRVNPLGLLAVGSDDPGRFRPGMGTLFLDLIADLLTAAIRRHLDDFAAP